MPSVHSTERPLLAAVAERRAQSEDRAIGGGHQRGAGRVAGQITGGTQQCSLAGVEIEGREPVASLDRLAQVASPAAALPRPRPLRAPAPDGARSRDVAAAARDRPSSRLRVASDGLQHTPWNARRQWVAENVVYRDSRSPRASVTTPESDASARPTVTPGRSPEPPLLPSPSAASTCRLPREPDCADAPPVTALP